MTTDNQGFIYSINNRMDMESYTPPEGYEDECALLHVLAEDMAPMERRFLAGVGEVSYGFRANKLVLLLGKFGEDDPHNYVARCQRLQQRQEREVSDGH